MKKQPERPVLITDAARSQNDQLRSREIRYVSMMAVRAACLIAGAFLISARPPLLPLWLGLCAAGMVFLPWAAVLIANDRPPKSRATPPAPRPEATPKVLDQRPDEHTASRTIDVEPTP